jgi:uncharacterized protein (TIGR02611 family)
VSQPPGLVRKLREQRERHLERSKIYRAAFVAAGVIILLAGLAMLVLPGPGILVVAVALAMLSLEFEWAERMLEKAVIQADAAKEKAKGASPQQRVLTGLAIAAGAGAAIALVLNYDIGPF